jgi:hypothetical protein
MPGELPDDVLALIRHYSEPVFIHFREYNDALRLFDLPLEYKQKLKNKIGDPTVREQIKICRDAHDDYHKKKAIYDAVQTPVNEHISDKSNWWASVSRDKFVALLDETRYRMQGYAEWYFEDDIDDAWRDSDIECAEDCVCVCCDTDSDTDSDSDIDLPKKYTKHRATHKRDLFRKRIAKGAVVKPRTNSKKNQMNRKTIIHSIQDFIRYEISHGF